MGNDKPTNREIDFQRMEGLKSQMVIVCKFLSPSNLKRFQLYADRLAELLNELLELRAAYPEWQSETEWASEALVLFTDSKRGNPGVFPMATNPGVVAMSARKPS
jgi:hypothetical protein